MRRALVCLVGLFALLVLFCPVFADNTATGASFSAQLAQDGSCQATLELQLFLDSPVDSLILPLPAAAKGVTVNGSSVRTQWDGRSLNADLSALVSGAVGAFSLRVQYTLTDVLLYNEQGVPSVQLPMLSGFQLPMQSFSFSVNLPSAGTEQPHFSSGYYQQTIEADMTWAVSGNQITGSVNTELKERETLEMSLAVPEGMFPAKPVARITVGFQQIAMVVLAVLALLYWLIFLSVRPVLPMRNSSAPEGCTAGQVPCRLMGQGADLTMTVLSWAQLGYILIHTDAHGRVIFHKRMEMGNERSPWEVRLFRDLFGKRTSVEGTGYRYANLCRRVAATCPEWRGLYRKGGSIRIFRILAAGAGLFAGVDLGIRLAGGAFLSVLLTILLAAACAVGSWWIQGWMRGVHMHYRRKLWIALGICGLWLLLGALGGAFFSTLWVVLGQLLAGALAAYGGRRTEMGRQSAAELLGLRQYLTGVSAKELQRLHSSDPCYFFSLAPWALAFGVEKTFARKFGGKRLPACPWLTSGMDAHMTAAEWSAVMRQTVNNLDRIQKTERLIRK